MSKIRLYKYLSDVLTDGSYTTPEIKRNIIEFGVLIDNVINHNQLQWVYIEQSINTDHWPKRLQSDTSKIKILSEDDDCLVILKPKGLPVQEGAGHKFDNVVTWLHNNYPSQNFHKKYSDKSLPLSGLAHRIDINTQGVLLIAKTPLSLQHFQDQFRERKVHKKYLAIVDGIMDRGYVVNAWQCRDRLTPLKQRFFWNEEDAKKYEKESRNSHSIIRPIASCKDSNQTLIEVKIKTGRMHQVRLHCENIGFAISSDQIYNKTKILDMPDFLRNGNNKELFLSEGVKLLSKDNFAKVKTEIFEEGDFCLLSNELGIQSPTNSDMLFVAKDLSKIRELNS